MEKSFDSGLFWSYLALRHSSLFDEIYWKYIDQMFFGLFTTMEDRLRLLTAEEQDHMDIIVREKMKQVSEGKLDSHYSIDELVEL